MGIMCIEELVERRALRYEKYGYCDGYCVRLIPRRAAS